MQTVPAGEIAERLVSFQALLAGNNIDAAVIRQNADLFYFTGTVQDSHLIVPASGRPVLLVRRTVERAFAESPIRPIVPMKSLGELKDALFDACGTQKPEKIGFELDVLPANTFFTYDEKVFPQQHLIDISMLIRQLRAIKSSWEIDRMRRTAEIARVVADSVPLLLRPGMVELDLHAELEAIARKAGNTGAVRIRSFNLEMDFGHILSGPNAAVPSYSDSPTGGSGLSPAFGQGSGDRRIGAGEIVSVDIMFCRDGYLNDQTRNYCIGPPPRRLADAYKFVKSANERVRELARPGTVTGELYETVRRWADKAGWGKWFMGHKEPRVTFIGHGIGLEVDEFPFIAAGQKQVLREGMVFAFEPKVVIPEDGVAGLENTYVVTSQGLESLNTATEELVII
ncbi:MAG: Xaa-Pro peptidase family protein [Syntrophobacteraceae bacterium]